MATFAELIANKRDEINTKRSLHDQYASELEQLRTQPNVDQSRVESLRASKARAAAALVPLEEEYEALKRESDEDDLATRAASESHPGAQRQAPTGYTNERSRTYNPSNEGTFLRDLFQFSTGSLRRDGQERLERHEREIQDGPMAKRAASTTTFGGIIPPQYLIDQYALVARAGRPMANVVQHLQIPDEGMSFVIPRGTTGVTTGIQTAENTVIANQDQVWTNLTVPVFTVAAYNDVSRQSLDRASGVDQIVFGDLAATYAVGNDQQVISGTGSSGQGLGILNTAGVGQSTAYTAAATVASFYSKVVGQINQIQTTRFLAPDIIAMHPRRWNWLCNQLDSTGRPLVLPAGNGPTNAFAISQTPIDTGKADAVGSMLGIPIITDANLPTTVGTASEDVVIVARKEDLLLWEDPSAPFELKFEQTLASSLTVRLVAYGYGAFTAGRFPTAVSVVGGNSASTFGQVAPTF